MRKNIALLLLCLANPFLFASKNNSSKKQHDIEFLTDYATFLSATWVAANFSADSYSNEEANQYANEITDVAWQAVNNHVSDESLWQKTFNSVQHYWKKHRDLKIVRKKTHKIVSDFAQENDEALSSIVRALNISMTVNSELYENKKFNCFTNYWKKRVASAFTALTDSRSQRNKALSKLVQKPGMGEDALAAFTKGSSDFAKKEAEEFSKEYTKHLLSKLLRLKGEGGVYDRALQNENTQKFLKTLGKGQNLKGSISYEYLNALMKKAYKQATKPAIEQPIEYVFGSYPSPAKGLQEMSLKNVQESNSLEVGSEVVEYPSVTHYLRSLRDNSAGILYLVTTDPAAEVSSKNLVKRLLPFGGDSISDKVNKKVSEKLLQDAVQFTIDSVVHYFAPTKPLRKPVGFTVLDGKKHFVYSSKPVSKTDILVEELIKEKGFIHRADVNKQGLEIGNKIVFKNGLGEKAKKLTSYVVERAYDVGLETAYEESLNSYYAQTTGVPFSSDANPFRVNHSIERLYKRMKELTDYLFKGKLMGAVNSFLWPYRPVAGITKVGRFHYYVHKPSAS